MLSNTYGIYTFYILKNVTIYFLISSGTWPEKQIQFNCKICVMSLQPPQPPNKYI